MQDEVMGWTPFNTYIHRQGKPPYHGAGIKILKSAASAQTGKCLHFFWIQEGSYIVGFNTARTAYDSVGPIYDLSKAGRLWSDSADVQADWSVHCTKCCKMLFQTKKN